MKKSAHTQSTLETVLIVSFLLLGALTLKVYGKHTVYSDGGSWYPEACSYVGLEHLLRTSLEKSIIERTIECFKDRTESFDDYYPCNNTIQYDLRHVQLAWSICVHT